MFFFFFEGRDIISDLERIREIPSSYPRLRSFIGKKENIQRADKRGNVCLR